jgi:glycosyltransferase involved in cell wall biosynthesis
VRQFEILLMKEHERALLRGSPRASGEAKSKRILMLITDFGQGGAERVFFDHATAFSQVYPVEEAVFEKSSMAVRAYDSGLPVHELRRAGIFRYLGPIGRLVGRSLALRRLVKDQRYDVVISHMDGANWVNSLSFSSARKVLVVHGSVFGDKNYDNNHQLVRRNLMFPVLYNLADYTVAVSDGIFHELTSECGVKKVVTISNFFDLKMIRSKASESVGTFQSIFDHPHVMITAGRLAKEKNQVQLIEVMSQLRDQGVDTRLVILGDGPLRHSLVARCFDLSLRTYTVWESRSLDKTNYDVYFLGYVSNPYAYIAKSYLFLLSSAWEGFPLALCEALICGVPVLSTDCPTGPREIMAPSSSRHVYDLERAEPTDCGILLPMFGTEEAKDIWTDVVKAVLRNECWREQMAIKAGRKSANFDRVLGVAKWLRLIDSL